MVHCSRQPMNKHVRCGNHKGLLDQNNQTHHDASHPANGFKKAVSILELRKELGCGVRMIPQIN